MLSMASLSLPLLVALASTQEAQQAPQDEYLVDTDTIYALAVDSAAHVEEDWVYLLDDGVLVYEADGSGRATYHQVIQILTQDAAEIWAEQTFSYQQGRERLTVERIRVVRPDGTLISEGPAHEQESVSPAPEMYPVYTDRIVKRISIGGLAPGTLLDIRHTTETLEPWMPGQFSSAWLVNPAAPVLRSRLVLDVPASLEPHIRETGLGFARRTVERGGRRVHIWATADAEPPEPETFASWPDDGSMNIDISGDIEWEDIARWYAGLARDRYQLTPAIEAQLGEVVAGARTLADSLRAVHRWVTRDIRYASLSLGLGGYQPRSPAEVLETKLGDCKDKATLFVALLARMGVEAYPVLVSLGATADSLLPSLDQFDHVIAAVSVRDGYSFVDLTADLVPYGSVPPSLQGGFALLVHPDGRGERLVIPRDPPESDRSETFVKGELSAEGQFSGWSTSRYTGATGYALREFLGRIDRLSASEKDQMIRSMADEVFPGASGDSLKTSDASDLTAQPWVSLWLRAPQAATRVGRARILTLPIPNLASPALVAQLEAELPRERSIDVELVLGPSVHSWTFQLTLPPGWVAELPSGVSETSKFGSYSAEYTQEGRAVRVRRELSGRRGREPAEAIDELIAWLRALAEDNVDYLLLRPADGEGARP